MIFFLECFSSAFFMPKFVFHWQDCITSVLLTVVFRKVQMENQIFPDFFFLFCVDIFIFIDIFHCSVKIFNKCIKC